jgi:hypothetical protein
MKLLKRGFIFAMLFALTGVGATFAAGTDNDNIQNFFLGNAPATSGDLNQVLALLVGPTGPPGAAGVAGKDGFVGLNGQDGRDGLDGAPGVAGEPGPAGAPGTSVAVVALAVGDRNCPIGGSKLVDATGAETFICNGRPGLPGTSGSNGGAGATGATGPAGPAGARGETGTAGTGGSGNANRFGVGSLGIGACDEAVNVELKHLFTGGQFTMNQIVISGIDDDCEAVAPAAATVLKVWLTVRSSGSLYGSGSVTGANYAYAAGDVIRCEKDITTSAWTGSSDARVMTIEGTHSCINTTATRTVVPRLNSISSRDLADYVGFEIG